jgi:hypothetical protein
MHSARSSNAACTDCAQSAKRDALQWAYHQLIAAKLHWIASNWDEVVLQCRQDLLCSQLGEVW